VKEGNVEMVHVGSRDQICKLIYKTIANCVVQ